MSSPTEPKSIIAQAQGTMKQNKSQANSPGTTSDHRRRTSASSGKFANLHAQKRNSADPLAKTRRASFAEQKPAAGLFGGLWQSFVKGTDHK